MSAHEMNKPPHSERELSEMIQWSAQQEAEDIENRRSMFFNDSKPVFLMSQQLFLLARDEYTHIDDLLYLFNHGNKWMVKTLASRETIPKELLLKFLSDVRVTRLVAHYQLSELDAEWLLAWAKVNDNPLVLIGMQHMTYLPESAMLKIVENNDANVARTLDMLTGGVYTSEAVLTKFLARKPLISNLRAAIEGLPRFQRFFADTGNVTTIVELIATTTIPLPVDLMIKFSTHESSLVRKTILRSQHVIPQSIITLMLRDSSPEIAMLAMSKFLDYQEGIRKGRYNRDLQEQIDAYEKSKHVETGFTHE